MKITHISRHQFHQTRWKSLYLLHGLLFQLASTSPIRNQEPRTSNNELHPSSRDPNAPEESWRVTDQAQASTLHDLRRIRKTDPSITILERFLVASHDSVDSKSEAKNEEAVYEQSLTLAPGDHLLVRYSHKQPSYLRSQISSPVVDSTFDTASLDITLAKNVTFSYSVFVPDQFDFRIPVKLPGIYGGTKSFEGKQSTGDDDTFQAYVMRMNSGIPHPKIRDYLILEYQAARDLKEKTTILAVEKDNLIQSTQMFPDRKTALFVEEAELIYEKIVLSLRQVQKNLKQTMIPIRDIPALAELAKENTAKIAAIPKPPSPEFRVDEDDDDDDEEEEDEDDEDSIAMILSPPPHRLRYLN
ncbi:hypothetical protein PCASD_16933 [Puccinia coronata f. sp. avenae]|uniref:Polysaccharide lyase 14 domain-containing protein n=1 Tax=Puccinia coronata f. sp. avenae TaxID=200324 RepID=A0A2N5T513_9BASI|nr:hypothetical protein PCASD_16933 [Puccinia coronata f. sp. avenae]